MSWWILVFYPEPLASMNYFNSDMSKSTNMVVYFDWKTVIYIYVCEKCHTQFMLPMEKSVTFTGKSANEIIPSINRSFVYKVKEGRHVRNKIRSLLLLPIFYWLPCIRHAYVGSKWGDLIENRLILVVRGIFIIG